MQHKPGQSPMERSWWMRIPVVGRLISTLSRPENHVLLVMGLLAAAGAILILFASVVAVGPGNILLSAVGGTVFGVSFSVSCSIVATRQATIEGYAKDANLRRKDELYGPLHTQFKRLNDQLRAASTKQANYPQWIDVPDQSHPWGQNFFPGYDRLALTLWLQFKADYRVDQFTSHARELFDKALADARAYNLAAVAVRKPVRDMLEQKLEVAIDAVQHSPAYKRWYHEQQEQNPETFPSRLDSQPRPTDTEHQVFVAIASGLRDPIPGHPLHKMWAGAWLEALPVQQPVTLGWILAHRPDAAAEVIFRSTIGLNPGAAVPQEWCLQVLTSLDSELDHIDEYHAFLAQAQSLELSLQSALHRLSGALSYIQERYEGGVPPA